MMYSGRGATDLMRTLDVHSSLICYAYLLDAQGLIRWRAHGEPTLTELQAMLKCTQELLQ